MNRRVLLLLILIVLAAFAWWLSAKHGNSSLAKPLSDFMVPDTSKVDRIFIAEQDGKTVDLRRRPDGTWSVNEVFNAKQPYVDLLLKTFLRVEVRSPVPKSAEANVLRVMGAASKKVEIYTGGKKPEKIWIVGHATKDNFGTYMLLEKPDEGRSSAPFVVNMSGFTGILNTRFHANLDDWRQSVVFAFPDLHEIAAVEVERPEAPTAAYRVENSERGDVRLLDHQGKALPMDTVLVKGALLVFQQLNYEYVERNLSSEQRDSLVATTPNHVLRLTRRDGSTETAKFWYKPYEGDLTAIDAPQQLHDKVRMSALVQDTLLVVVQRQMWDRVLQPVTAFRP
jgi:hypothetical protein